MPCPSIRTTTRTTRIGSVRWNSGRGGKVLFNYLGSPRRTAFTYMANQALGPMNPVVLNTAQGGVRGGISGSVQLTYRNAFYPRGYGQCTCQPQ